MDGQCAVDERKFINLMKGLKCAYTMPSFLPDDKAVKVWYAMLKDIPLDVLNIAVQQHIMISQFPPTISELRFAAAEIMAGSSDDWTEAWSKVLEIVSKYGIYSAVQGIGELDDVTREAVRRVGYWEICNSENIAIERANFRTAYEQIIERRKKDIVLTDKLKQAIEEKVLMIEKKEADDENNRR